MTETDSDLRGVGEWSGLGRMLLMIDAAAEVVIAGGLVAVALVGGSGAWRKPEWISSPLLLAVAGVFAVTAVAFVILARYVDRPNPPRLRTILLPLGLVNAVAAAAVIVWTLQGDALGGPLRIVVAVVGVAVASLGLAELVAARRKPG